MIRWNKEFDTFCSEVNLLAENRKKNLIKYATYFAGVISEGFHGTERNMYMICRSLLNRPFYLEFDEEAVEFLMKSKNLQILMADDKFLSAAFPSEHVHLEIAFSASSFYFLVFSFIAFVFTWIHVFSL